MKIKKIGNLYELLGDIIIGRATIVFNQEENSMDMSQLWYTQFDHINNWGSKEIYKRYFLKRVYYYKVVFCKYWVFEKHYRMSFNIIVCCNKDTVNSKQSNVWGYILIVSKAKATNTKFYYIIIYNQV